MSQPPPIPPSYRPPRRRASSGAITMLVVGIVLFVIGPVLGILSGTFSLAAKAIDYESSIVDIAPVGTVDLADNERAFLLAPSDAIPAVGHSACSAAMRSGAPAQVTAVSPRSFVGLSWRGRYEAFAQVSATEPGQVTIRCDTAGIPVVSARSLDPGEFLAPLLWWTVGGFGAAAIGLVLGIVGLVGVVRGPRD